jgi:hypothetical protein
MRATSSAQRSLSISTAVPQDWQVKNVFCCTQDTGFTVVWRQCGQTSGISVIIGSPPEWSWQIAQDDPTAMNDVAREKFKGGGEIYQTDDRYRPLGEAVMNAARAGCHPRRKLPWA